MPVWGTQWEKTIGQDLPDTVKSYRNAKATAGHNSGLYEAIDAHLSASVEKLAGRYHDPSKILPPTQANELIERFRNQAHAPRSRSGLSAEKQTQLARLAWHLRIANERVTKATEEARLRAAATQFVTGRAPAAANVPSTPPAHLAWTTAQATRQARVR
ncbi:hypothetical protein AB0J80_26045 [Actinoplanes sp. NPDC049548]|uniref:hypothetical protein n=1 Tax=Actinoplanes sp. NPDC049548 TaxID=3155152 RepID=UPI0034323C48